MDFYEQLEAIFTGTFATGLFAQASGESDADDDDVQRLLTLLITL